MKEKICDKLLEKYLYLKNSHLVNVIPSGKLEEMLNEYVLITQKCELKKVEKCPMHYCIEAAKKYNIKYEVN